MDPLGGAEALQGTLRLLVGLLALCLALLFLLNGFLLLRWRPAWPRVTGHLHSQAPPTSPQLLQVIPSGAAARHEERGVVAKALRCQAAGPLTSPLPSCRPGGPAVPCSWREPLGPKPPFCSQGQLRRGAGRGALSSSSDLDRHPVLVPPNSPVTTAGSHGAPGGGSASFHTSTQSKLRSCSRSVRPSHSVPFEYGSSIQRNDERTGLNSGNFTASQGPGLDSHFGASAGLPWDAWLKQELAAPSLEKIFGSIFRVLTLSSISVRILSSDSEDSPNAAQPKPQQLGQFEWDYYDPGYQQRMQPPPRLPQICSKQYWL